MGKAPLVKTIGGGGRGRLEGEFPAVKAHGFLDAPAHECGAPIPRHFRVESLAAGFVFVDAAADVGSFLAHADFGKRNAFECVCDVHGIGWFAVQWTMESP